MGRSALPFSTRPVLSMFPPFSTGNADVDDLNQDANQAVVELDEAALVCCSIHCPTSPTTSSFVSISQRPSVAITTKSPFDGSMVVVVTTGSAVTYGGVLSNWCG